MFGGKKIKEAEDKIIELEKVQEKFWKISGELRKTKSLSYEVFAELQAGDAKFEQGLYALSELIDAGTKADEATEKKISAFRKDLEKMHKHVETLKKEQEKAKKQEENGRKMTDAVREMTEMLEELQKNEKEALEVKEEALDDALANVTRLQESAGKMSVFALDAGIEAGRLGETGLEFLKAAESIRRLAEYYNELLFEIIDEINALKVSNSVEAIEAIRMKGEEAVNSYAVTETEESVLSTKLQEIVDEQTSFADEILQNIQETSNGFKDAKEQINALQTNNREGQKAKSELEEQLALVYEDVI